MLAPIQKSNYQLYRARQPRKRTTSETAIGRWSSANRCHSELGPALGQSGTETDRPAQSDTHLPSAGRPQRRALSHPGRIRTISYPASATSMAKHPRSTKPTQARKVSPLSRTDNGEGNKQDALSESEKETKPKPTVPSNAYRAVSYSASATSTAKHQHLTNLSQPAKAVTLSHSEDKESSQTTDAISCEPNEQAEASTIPDDDNLDVHIRPRAHTHSHSGEFVESGDLRTFRKRSDSDELRRLLAVKKLEQFRQEAGLSNREVIPALRRLSTQEVPTDNKAPSDQATRRRSKSTGDVAKAGFVRKSSRFHRLISRLRSSVST